MHIDLISLIAGMALVTILWASVAGAKGEPPKVVQDPDSPIPQPEWNKENHRLAVEVTLANTEACKALTAEMANAHAPSSKEDYNWLVSILEPHKEALFRIAADTELSKKKFDVLAKVIGIDEKAAYADHIDKEEDSGDVFNDLVYQEMKDQNLTWSQASDTVKARMAHRSRVR